MTSMFAAVGLKESTIQALTELGYEEPTPIQKQTIPLILEGKDLIAQAPTGTGKTGAFALPAIEHLNKTLHAPQILVLAPTRELAVQVAEAFHSYSKYSQVSILPIYGGQPIERQLRALKQGVQVVVGTPGRVLDHIRRRTLKLAQVHTLILDEADEMLNMGFQEDIEAILKELPQKRQTVMFSATMPKAILELAQRYLREPEHIKIAAPHATVSQIRQTYYEVGKRDKFEVLVRILDYETPSSAIIFCRTKQDVDTLGQRLAGRAYQAEVIHGDLNQSQRDRVMERFRSGQIDLLIATDVAARGLDIEQVSHVINYDIPLDPQSYTHRIGRTGRAGRTGSAITLVTPRERRLLQIIQQTTKSAMQRMQLPSIADVMERRNEEFKDRLRETLTAGNLEPYLAMVESLGEEFSPTELTAAAFKLLFGAAALDKLEDKLVETANEEASSNGKKRFRKATERKRSPFKPERGMTRLFINLGREDGVRPADIVGAIANEADIPGRSIGAIELYDGFSFVDVPSHQAQHVLQALNQSMIRNRKISASLAKPMKAPKNA
jgi:ATP-dependent RNA helicase DeaD